MDKNSILIAVAVLFREQGGKTSWFITKKPEDNSWEFPKVIVRKGESSVRATLRIMGEKGGMTTKVLEEAGRTNSVVNSDNKVLQQRIIYYLILLKNGSNEAVGFGENVWLEYPKALLKLTSKKEKQMLKSAKEMLKIWKKERKNRKVEEPDFPEEAVE